MTLIVSIIVSLNSYSLATSQIFSTHNFISWQRWHPSQFFCRGNLGFIFDSDMSFTDQINFLSKSCHFHRYIRRIHHLLPLSAATALANSLVSSKLDYCNSVCNGIYFTNVHKIQHIIKTPARVITITSKLEHTTPILKQLTSYSKRSIDYKLCLLAYTKLLSLPYLLTIVSRSRLTFGPQDDRIHPFCISHIFEHLCSRPWFKLLRHPLELTPYKPRHYHMS